MLSCHYDNYTVHVAFLQLMMLKMPCLLAEWETGWCLFFHSLLVPSTDSPHCSFCQRWREQAWLPSYTVLSPCVKEISSAASSLYTMGSLDITMYISFHWEVKVHQQDKSTKIYSFILSLHAAFAGVTDTQSKSHQSCHLSVTFKVYS